MSSIIPRPLREIFVDTHDSLIQTAKQDPSIGVFTGLGMKWSQDDRYQAVVRMAFVAISAFAAHQMGASLAVGSVLMGMMSLPALGIGIGSVLAYEGITAVIASLASGSFTTFGLGLAALAAGWIVLEVHDFVEIGLLESSIQSYANRIWMSAS